MMEQVIFDSSEICRLHGVKYAVFSPGSRNAALSLSFHRNKKIETFVLVDERSAAFVALGIAQQTNSPVILCCTSGTALLNYGPAVAEAFYQGIPLIILSADRPPEWIDQWDGQTIRQQNVFQNHVKGFAQMPIDRSSPASKREYVRKLASAINLSTRDKPGPCHVNIPFREPFYPSKKQVLSFSNDQQKLKVLPGRPKVENRVLTGIAADWGKHRHKVILLGHGLKDDQETRLLMQLAKEKHIPVISDIHANGHNIEGVIRHHDLFLANQAGWKDLRPDLIVSLGQSVVSKHLKRFLRDVAPLHWHIETDPFFADPFNALETIIPGSPNRVLKAFLDGKGNTKGFANAWHQQDQKAAKLIESEIEALPFSEFVAFGDVLRKLPTSNVDLHLGNSMPIRYANYFGLSKGDVRVFANRGTSGIDGTNATAVGHALTTNRKVVLLTGDLAFLYDRNAFFHPYDLTNLYVVVFNNFGGGIFDLIPGARDLPVEERQTHFTTNHSKDFKMVAADAGFSYLKANDEVTLELALSNFFLTGEKPKLLEIQTDPTANRKVFEQVMKAYQ